VVTQTLALNGTDLRCASSVGNAVQPIASNVEDFQVTFGQDTNADGSVDLYVAPTTANAPNTIVARVCVLIRTAPGVSPGGQQYVDCNGAAVTAGAADTRMRRAFTKVIGLRNRLG
jgi:type IV pilus assembly protein PilW